MAWLIKGIVSFVKNVVKTNIKITMKKLFVLIICCFMFSSCNQNTIKVKQDVINYVITNDSVTPTDVIIKYSKQNNIFVVRMYWIYENKLKTLSPIYKAYSYNKDNDLYELTGSIKYNIIEQEFPDALSVEDYLISKNIFEF